MDWLVKPDVCPGLFYGTPAADGFLVRLRIPGGQLQQEQVRAIATILPQWGDPTLQITNRGNLQLRGIQTAPTPETFQILQTVGLAAHHPQIDRLRNFMASPTAGIDPQELLDTRPYIHAVDAYLQKHPELASLPAKFSVGFDGGGQVGIGVRSPLAWEHRYNEIQLSAVALEDGIYFHLALGGDKKLWDTQIFVKPEDCILVIAALATVYLEYSQQHSSSKVKQNQSVSEVELSRSVSGVEPSRSAIAPKQPLSTSGVEQYRSVSEAEPTQPRMKHLLQDLGVDYYLQQVSKLLPQPLVRKSALIPVPTLPYAHWGVYSQKQPELSYVGINLPLGQVSANQWRGLGKLSATFGTGELRLTPWQSILLPNIPQAQVPELLENLRELGLSATAHRPDAAIVACAGKPGCKASATPTQLDALTLGAYLMENLPTQTKLQTPVNIHLTGCAKSCAQPSPAEIMLLGTRIPQDEIMVEGYDIYVGGDGRSQPQLVCQGTLANLLPQITQLLQNGGGKEVGIPAPSAYSG